MDNFIGVLCVGVIGYLFYRMVRGGETAPSHHSDDREVRELVRNIEDGKDISPAPFPSVEKLPFRKNPFFFTPTERAFFSVLQNIAVRNNLSVFAKVRLEDLLTLPRMDTT